MRWLQYILRPTNDTDKPGWGRRPLSCAYNLQFKVLPSHQNIYRYNIIMYDKNLVLER
jgi:hypothetical protein